MRIPLRAATGLVAAGCTLAVAAAAWGAARLVARQAMVAHGHRHLAAATSLGADLLRGSQDLPLDSLSEALALATGYRVSVFGADRRLIADSSLERPVDSDPAPAGERTEVDGALSRARARSTRSSAVDGRPYLFSAARLYRGGQQAVLRLGAPAEPINEAASRVALWAAVAVLAAGAGGLAVIDRGSQRTASVLHDIRRLLARIGESRTTGSRVKLPAMIELARLASAANRVRARWRTRWRG